MNRSPSSLRTVVLAAVTLVCFSASPGASADEILVSAASSLTDAMKEIGREFTRQNPGVSVRLNLGASGPLQKQMENGAPADVFVSAGTREMDALDRGGKLLPGTRINVTANRLVLVVPLRSPIRKWDDLALPSVRRVALSSPDSVPSGRFARETLERRRLWDAVKAKAVFGQNVRQTLAYAARGDADAGIVFASDAAIERGRLRIAQYAVPGVDHAPIVYPAAVVGRTRHPAAAKRFLAFLRTPAAQALFARSGFASLAPPRKK